MKPIEEYFFYTLHNKYNAVCQSIYNLRNDKDFLDIVSQLKVDLKQIFKKHKFRISPKEWSYFDENLSFTKNFWDKFILNDSARQEYDDCFSTTITKIDDLKQLLWDSKNKLRLDMWAHINTIPVDLFRSDKLEPIYYFVRTSYGKTYQDEAIDLAQNLFRLNFACVITKCLGTHSNNYKPEYSYMVWANVKPEYAELLLNAWPMWSIDNEVPHWLYPMSVNQELLQEYANLPNIEFDDYSAEGER